MNFGKSEKNQNKDLVNPKNNLKKEIKFDKQPEKFWTQIVNELRSTGKIVLYTNLMNTRATQINDQTIGIQFEKGMTSFGKTVLEKPENKKELELLVSKACKQEMNIKYLSNELDIKIPTQEEKIVSLAKESDIPFNIID